MEEPKTVSEARIALSKNINEILKKIYKNISNDKFDLKLDLGEFSSAVLKDFWLYTSGFLFVQNFENILKNMSTAELNDILNGHFELKELSNDEADKILSNVGIKRKRSGFNYNQDVETIQDGKYSINFNKSVTRNGRRKFAHILTLDTDEVILHTNNQNIQITEEQAITVIRNIIVHSVPYINGNKLYLPNSESDVDFEISKMWLRGFSETFTRELNPISSEKIEKQLVKKLNTSKLDIKNENDIDNALSLVLDCFDDEIKQNFFRVNNFVKLRTKYVNGFFDKSLEDKCKIIAEIIANNPDFLTSSRQSINPEILYEIQQLVSVELNNRENENFVDDDDSITIDAKALLNRCKYLENLIKKIDPNTLTNPRSQEFKRAKQIIDEYDYSFNKLKRIAPQLVDRYKQETASMNFFDENSYMALENLPVEVGVNLVCLMGYNSLVTSSFYEDLLVNTDFNHLSREQNSFFSRFDLKGIKVNYMKRVDPKNYSPSDKAIILLYLRNAICHGQIKFSLPPVKASQKANFKDVMVEFTAAYENVQIKATVESLYNLFSSSPFTWDRSKNIITGKIEEYGENPDDPDFEEEDNDEESENSKDRNQPE